MQGSVICDVISETPRGYNYVIYCFYLCVYIFTLTIVKIVFNHQQYKLRHTRSIIINLRELIFEIRISFKKYDTLKLLEKKEKNIQYPI